MRVPTSPAARVLWEEGMYLAPQHFQAQRRHFEDGVARALGALAPFGYGLTTLDLDADALANGTLALREARGILPDGTLVQLPDGDAPPPPIALAARFLPTQEAHVAYLALAPWRADAPNVGDAAPERRFVAVTREIPDEASGQEPATVRFAARNLRLLLDHELLPDDVALPLVRLQRDGMGHYVVDEAFVPPVLQIAASPRLLALLRTVVGMLEVKGAALAASLAPAAGGAAVAYAGNEVATRWLLHAVRSAEAPLRHLLSARRAHPERLWLELSRLAGALATFSLGTPAASLPLYDHDAPGPAFDALERHLRTHLDVVVAARAVVVPLVRVSDVLHTATVADPRCFQSGARWFLGARSELGAGETIARVPALAKACAARFVLELVRRAYPGLPLAHVPAPPPGLAPRPDLAYFELTLEGPCAQGLQGSHELGVYVPDGLPGATLELAVLTPV